MVKLNPNERERYLKFHIPGCNCIHTLKVNAFHLSIANSLKHEQKKLEIAYNLMKQHFKILTEAAENKKQLDGTELRRDIVDISNGEIYEIEDSKSKRGHRHPSNINVVWYDE